MCFFALGSARSVEAEANDEPMPLAIVYTRCSEPPPLIDGAEVTAQVRVELGNARIAVINESASALSTPSSVLQLHVCGASARVMRVWPSGLSEEREIDLAELAPDARVRVTALVLGELGRTDAEDPGARATPAAPVGERHVDDDLAQLPALPPRPAPAHLSQNLTFVARSFVAPAALAFGPRIALAFANWEFGIETATASTTHNATQIVVGLATATVGYTILSVGHDARVDVTPSVELGPTWFRTSASADSDSRDDNATNATTLGDAGAPGSHKRGVWAAASLRAGINVALTPPIYARFAAFGGIAQGLRARVGNVTELTTRGVFGGIAIGVGWER